jgi:2-dehydro-3-deoxygalactonokinase
MTDRITPDWIALHVAPDQMTAWAMQDTQVLAHTHSPLDQSSLDQIRQDQAAFEAMVLSLGRDWDLGAQTRVLTCGLDPADYIWAGTPYRPVPCPARAETVRDIPATAFALRAIQGLSQKTPADVMSGPETTIAGFLALNPKWDGVICLPSPRCTIWAQVSAQEVVSFQTYMTGELFALLSQHSILRHAVQSNDFDETAFDTALEEALRRPEKLAARLSEIRAETLLAAPCPSASRARLLGLLIGAEIAAARPYWLGTQIAIIANMDQASPYSRALTSQGAPATIADPARMTLAGLSAVHRQL